MERLTGQAVESCAILTTTPNSLLADVHDRMPVILSPEHYDLWLDPGFWDACSLSAMLRPFNASSMKRYPVSTRVNTVANDDPECAARSIAIGAGASSNQLWLPNVDTA
jgi:putative SOS response-associated peptidase YedK